jgi:hypothetical protein
MKWYLYSMSPIDCWQGCQFLPDFIDSLPKPEDYVENDLSSGMTREQVLSTFEFLLEAAIEHVYFDGVIRDSEMFVFAVPQEESCALGYVWKQDRNGATFVASPVPMPWLDYCSNETAVISS